MFTWLRRLFHIDVPVGWRRENTLIPTWTHSYDNKRLAIVNLENLIWRWKLIGGYKTITDTERDIYDACEKADIAHMAEVCMMSTIDVGLCAKTTVHCTLIAPDGRRWIGKNWCMNPQVNCPREEGEGYEKCTTICGQIGHTEAVVARMAGPEAAGGIAYLEGHTYACDHCKAALAAIGVTDIRIEAPPTIETTD